MCWKPFKNEKRIDLGGMGEVGMAEFVDRLDVEDEEEGGVQNNLKCLSLRDSGRQRQHGKLQETCKHLLITGGGEMSSGFACQVLADI